MIILPAILVEDAQDAARTSTLFQGVAPWLHIDYADGTMTDRTTADLAAIGAFVKGCRTEVHLMTTQPEEYFDACDVLGASRVYVHLDTVESPQAVIDEAVQHHFALGAALKPETKISSLNGILDMLDAVQIMTVEPGHMGSVFIVDCLEKVRELKMRKPQLWVSVDGGVSEETLRDVRDSGADAAAVGSALQDTDTAQQRYRILSA